MKNCLSSLRNHLHAFSLVEMLMALLVASLLLAALAPVMTRRMADENITLSGNMNPAGTTQHIVEIEYNSDDCSEIKTDSDGSTYCEGEFVVPGGYNGYINATVIGGGGGGGTAPTAGYAEYTNEGSVSTFAIPAMTGSIEATLVSGGGGGGTDSVAKTQTFVTYGNGNIIPDDDNKVIVDSDGAGTWTIPVNSKGKDMLVTACGGGGGGGSAGKIEAHYVYNANGYGGGSGGYIQNKIINFGNESNISYYIGGGGASIGENGKPYGGGGAYYADASTGGGKGGDAYPGKHATSASCTSSSEKGGAGGIGEPYGRQNTCLCGTSYSPNAILYVKGGDGGQPGGGGGSLAHYGCCISSAGGGGGGASQLLVNSGIICNASGGGGGGGAVRPVSTTYDCCRAGEAGAGGGGGGKGGGTGGGSASNAGKGGIGGRDGNGYLGGILTSNIFGGNYCDGGNGGLYLGADKGYAGKSGAIRLFYIDYDISKGKGGKAGNVISNKKINTAQNDIFTVNIGTGGTGGTAARIEKSGDTGTFTAQTEPAYGRETVLKKSSSIILDTGKSTEKSNTKDGESLSLFNGENICTGGKGGTSTKPDAIIPTAGYGCGGGAGYMNGNGSKGSGGYARMVWNKNWDEITNSYKLSETGAGGGGASGNILTYSVEVKSNQIIKFRIGKGGNGAYVSNNALINAVKGGDTVFGDIKAGGGGGGASVSINAANEPVNGAGGSISNICHFGAANYINNKKCIKGTRGSAANNLTGGKGADFTGYTIAFKTKNNEESTETKKEIKGTGGSGGTADTGDNANGENAQGIASGGGGASLRDMGQVNSSSTGNITNNQNKGGNGANGKIILEWWE